MKYAEVAVDSPAGGPTPFSYSIPEHLSLQPGQAVWVPFGARTVQGVVVALSDEPKVENTRDVFGLVQLEPVLSQTQLELASWISEYYFSPLFEAVALMLPPGLERKTAIYYEPARSYPELTESELSPDELKVLILAKKEGRLSQDDLEKDIGKKAAKVVADRLIRLRLLTSVQIQEKPRVKAKLSAVVSLRVESNKLGGVLNCLRTRRAAKQIEVLEFLANKGVPIPLADVRTSLHVSHLILRTLEHQGLVAISEIETRIDPLAHLSGFTPAFPPTLTASQQVALAEIKQCLEKGERGVFLLRGATGSGKTEIYLRALAETVTRGKKGICLVPEITLTAQTIERFVERFPGRVGVFHSGLSLRQRFDEWYAVKSGGFDVVIGPRSALFVPQPDLGLIIIDEEHEWSYKQENAPRYHARDAAIKLAELQGASVILGSATPDIESYYRAQMGEYRLLELRERITPVGVSSLPEVETIDMRQELREGNSGIFSRRLSEGIEATLNRGEQVILFLNRRGTATFVQCPKCGFVYKCKKCSVALTYHATARKLLCHHCHYSVVIPRACAVCGARQLRFIGIGTEAVQEEVERCFPRARVLRWDSDSAASRRAPEELLSNFRTGKTNVLVGTQMVVKGLHLPEVTLSGVVNADTGLNLPDFRAGERAFQLLCQVAGRAGRGHRLGRAIIQTYSPDHYAVKAAAHHDYNAFYEQELKYRRQFGYPPYSRLLRLLYGHSNQSICREEAERMKDLLLEERERKGMTNLSFIGPTPILVSRVRGKYWWHIIVRGKEPDRIVAGIRFPKGWILDMDPVGLV